MSLQSKTVCLIINFKQYSSLERQKRNKKTCNTYFCLTVKRVIAEAYVITIFLFFFLLVLPSQRQGQRERFYDVWVAIHKKIWMGAYWKLYLHGWLSLDLNEASSVNCKFYLFDHFIGQIVILFFLLYLFLFTFFF